MAYLGRDYLPIGIYAPSIRRGVMYAANKATRKVGKSLDYGKTWRWFPFVFPHDLQSVFPTHDDLLFACASGRIYRSDNDGLTWTEVFQCTFTPYSYINMWGWGQAPDGTLYTGEYGNKDGENNIINCAYLWRSTDQGLTWIKMEFFHDKTSNHIHQCKVNRRGRVYVTIGDTPKRAYFSDDHGDNWTEVTVAGYTTGYTGFTQTDAAVFFGDDLSPGNNHVWKTTDGQSFSIVFTPPTAHNTQSTTVAAYGDGEIWFTAFNELQEANTKSVIYMSPDAGDTWELIAEEPSGGYQFCNPAIGWDGTVSDIWPYFICENKENNQIMRVQRKQQVQRPFLLMKEIDGPQLSQKWPRPI